METTLKTLTGDKLISFTEDTMNIFYGDKIVLSLSKNGEIRIKSKLIDVDQEVVYGVRELLKNLERGSVIEHA